MFILYITTCLPSGKVYIGIHEQNDPWTFDGYLGSGKTILKSIKKYGKENFIRETLFYFYDVEDACAKEAEIVNEEFVNQDWNYNIVVGGGKPPKMTKEVMKKTAPKISAALKGKPKSSAHRKSVKDSWADPVVRARHVFNEVSKERHRNSMVEVRSRPGLLERTGKAISASLMNNEKERARRSQMMRDLNILWKQRKQNETSE